MPLRVTNSVVANRHCLGISFQFDLRVIGCVTVSLVFTKSVGGWPTTLLFPFVAPIECVVVLLRILESLRLYTACDVVKSIASAVCGSAGGVAFHCKRLFVVSPTLWIGDGLAVPLLCAVGIGCRLAAVLLESEAPVNQLLMVCRVVKCNRIDVGIFVLKLAPQVLRTGCLDKGGS